MMSFIRNFFIIACSIVCSYGYATDSLWYSVRGGLSFSSESESAFWLNKGKEGVAPNGGGAWMRVGSFGHHVRKKMQWDYGLEVAGNDKAWLHQYYAAWKWGRFRLQLGARSLPKPYHGLSSSLGSYLWSGNARPIPQLEWSFPDFVYFWKGRLGLKLTWSDGIMLDENRRTKNPRILRRNLYLKVVPSSQWNFTIGGEMVSMWGGEHPNLSLETGWEAYLRVLNFSSGTDTLNTNESRYVLGNHLGNLSFEVQHKSDDYVFSFYYLHPFEDHSGISPGLHSSDRPHLTSLKMWLPTNLGDGIFGLSGEVYSWNTIRAISVEVFNFTSHGGAQHPHGIDNYFKHAIYGSGWTYHGQTVGIPFITTANNILWGIHLGLSGVLFRGKASYKLKTSFSINHGVWIGTHNVRGRKYPTAPEQIINYARYQFEEGRKRWSTGLELVPISYSWHFPSIEIGFDTGAYYEIARFSVGLAWKLQGALWQSSNGTRIGSENIKK